MTKHFILTISTLILFLSCQTNDISDRPSLGEDYAREQLKSALADSLRKEVLVDTIITDKQTATEISESILFAAYGKDNITNQRPYEVYLVDNHWVLSGTLPKGSDGGTFLIILDAKDGKVIRLTHGK